MRMYDESYLPAGYYAKVAHLHEGNTSRNQLKKLGKTNTKYITICRIYKDDKPFAVGKGVAVCSQKDNPSRQLGRAIAFGRAMKEAKCDY